MSVIYVESPSDTTGFLDLSEGILKDRLQDESLTLLAVELEPLGCTYHVFSHRDVKHRQLFTARLENSNAAPSTDPA